MNNTLYQLGALPITATVPSPRADGCRAGPVSHGPTTADTLLQDAAGVVREFMARDPEELRFTVIALAKA